MFSLSHVYFPTKPTCKAKKRLTIREGVGVHDLPIKNGKKMVLKCMIYIVS